MTQEQINSWLADDGFRAEQGTPELVETHISWVVLCDDLVYKIKKPVHFSFVNFSSLALRKFYCEREVLLNNRLSENIYLDVQPIRSAGRRLMLDSDTGEIVEYAVRMRKVDRDRQMDRLLRNGLVKMHHMEQLASRIARFHEQAVVVTDKNLTSLRSDFNDLRHEQDFLGQQMGAGVGQQIAKAIQTSDEYLGQYLPLVADRLRAGFFRDCHGDLHSRNIFLLDTPQPFDCLEFNDELRQIDVLNEVAFLCMDLESFGRKDLADQFLATYLRWFPAIRHRNDEWLLLYYKAYRANIRAKVNSLRARTASTERSRVTSLAEAGKYLAMLSDYLQLLEHRSTPG